MFGQPTFVFTDGHSVAKDGMEVVENLRFVTGRSLSLAATDAMFRSDVKIEE